DLVELLGGGGFHRRLTRFFGRHWRLPGGRPRVPDAGLFLGSSLFHAPHASGGRPGVHQYTQIGFTPDLLDVQVGHTPDPGYLRRFRTDREYLIVRAPSPGRTGRARTRYQGGERTVGSTVSQAQNLRHSALASPTPEGVGVDPVLGELQLEVLAVHAHILGSLRDVALVLRE